MRIKIELYILSLGTLFALLWINKATAPICFGKDCEFIGLWALVKMNWIPSICTIGLFYCVYIFFRFRDSIIKSSKQGPWEIEQIEVVSFENLSFLATFIVPLLCFDLDFNLDEGRNALMLVLVLFVIGVIYIKANLYYTNPSLALFNFKIYKIEYRHQGKSMKCIALSRDKLQIGDTIFSKHIDDKIYYSRKSTSNEQGTITRGT